jgi:Kdo2-lipid IVA lauroyltransferase/acyltransferase
MYAFMNLFVGMVSCLSPRALERLAAGLAWLLFDVLRFRRTLILKNLTIAFGDDKSPAEKIQIGRRSVYHFLLTVMESFTSKRYPIDAHIELHDAHHLQAALDQGQGIYVLCFHMGNWEAMAAKVSHDFKPVYAVMKTIGSPGMNRFVEETRERNGLHWIKRVNAGDAYRGIVNVLKRGEVVGFIIDQARPGEPRLPFFSKDAKTNTSLAAIWQKRPSPIVPAYIYRTSFGRHVLTFEAALDLTRTEDRKADLLTHSTRFNEVVAAAIRKHPEHYFWLHNRWK